MNSVLKEDIDREGVGEGFADTFNVFTFAFSTSGAPFNLLCEYEPSETTAPTSSSETTANTYDFGYMNDSSSGAITPTDGEEGLVFLAGLQKGVAKIYYLSVAY